MEACAEECACFSFTIAEKSSLHFCASALGSISCACLGVPSCTFVFTLTSFGVFRRISFKSCYWCREIRNASEWPGIIRCFSKWRLFLFQSKLVHSTLARLDLSTTLTGLASNIYTRNALTLSKNRLMTISIAPAFR